jgi:hypothetical protein
MMTVQARITADTCGHLFPTDDHAAEMAAGEAALMGECSKRNIMPMTRYFPMDD